MNYEMFSFRYFKIINNLNRYLSYVKGHPQELRHLVYAVAKAEAAGAPVILD